MDGAGVIGTAGETSPVAQIIAIVGILKNIVEVNGVDVKKQERRLHILLFFNNGYYSIW